MKTITRRALFQFAAALALRAQQFFHVTYATLVFQTTKTTGFNPTIIAPLTGPFWHWPDGTFTNGSANKTLAAGTKTVRVQSQFGWAGVGTVSFSARNMVGPIPQFIGFTGMNSCSLQTNLFTGSLPTFAQSVNLLTLRVDNNTLSGTLPNFAPCTKMTSAQFQTNSFSGYTTGGFATQKSLATLNFNANALPTASVNAILADCVTSLGISGRVTCTLNLAGGTNGAPSGQGIVDKATLITAGWTVTTN